MSLKNKLILFSFIVLLSFCIDKYNNPCKNEIFFLNMTHLVHHAFSNFLYYGSLFFGYHLYHLLIMLMTFLSWYFYDGRCIVSDIYNKYCGFPIKNRHKDLTYYLVDDFLKINIYVFLAIIVLYNLINILKNSKIKNFNKK